MKQDDKKIQIRNSTVDFLVFTKDAHEEGIEVRVQSGTVWLTQKAISELFDIDRSVVNKHLKNIYETAFLPSRTPTSGRIINDGKIYFDEPLYQKSRLCQRGKAAAIYGNARRCREVTAWY